MMSRYRVAFGNGKTGLSLPFVQEACDASVFRTGCHARQTAPQSLIGLGRFSATTADALQLPLRAK